MICQKCEDTTDIAFKMANELQSLVQADRKILSALKISCAALEQILKSESIAEIRLIAREGLYYIERALK